MRDLLDFKIYLDISDDVKFAWKLQRDMAERGHSEESIKQSISARKPDFDAYIDPQKKHADVILQVKSAARPVRMWFHGSHAAMKLGTLRDVDLQAGH